MKPIFISYYWGPNNICKNSETVYVNKVKKKKQPITYGQLVTSFAKQMKKYDLDYCIEEHPEFDKKGMYQRGLSYKPTFIKHMLKTYKRPVVFMDIDMKLYKKPILFDNDYFDFMAFNWNFDPRVHRLIDYNTFETSSGIYYFNHTKQSIKLLNNWISKMKRHINKADDRMLSIVFNKHRMIEKLKCYWIPMEYFHLPQFYKLNPKHVIIQHPYELTSEEHAHNLGSCKNRSLNEYDIIVQNIQHKHYINENPAFYFTKEQIKQLKHRNDYFKNVNVKYTNTKYPKNNISYDICKITKYV